MLEVLIGIGMSIITQLVKKTGIDGKLIILILSIIAGGVYYFMKESNPELLQRTYEYFLWVYWFSQIIYNYIIKIWEEKPLNHKKEKNG